MKPVVLNFNDPIETLSASKDLFFFTSVKLNKKEKKNKIINNSLP